ncbi:MAG: glycosyltransferase [Acutalibacteraceae bacterium]
MSIKNVLIRNDLVFGGGVENVMYNLVNYLSKRGYRVTVAGEQCKKREFYKSYPQEVRFVREKLFYERQTRYSIKWLFAGCLNRIYKLYYEHITKRHYDVAIALKEGPCMKELVCANAEKKFAWVHVDYNYAHWTSCCFKSNEEERQYMRQYDRVVCVSQSAADSVVHTIGDPGNLCVKYNPLDVKRIKELSAVPDEQIKRSEKLIFVSVGRLAKPKNYPLLLQVCTELEKKYNFEVWIIGDGPEEGAIKKMIEELGTSSVRLLGKKGNPYCIMSCADVFVSSSTCESYGLAIQEALILGLPVVAVKCPAIEEVFDKRFGILSDNSFGGLYEAIEKMLLYEELRRQCKNNIKNYYRTDNLYEKRLHEICRLWE